MITPAQADPEFAEMAVQAAIAERHRDPELSAYLAKAADYWCPPSAHRSSARVRLAMAGLGRRRDHRAGHCDFCGNTIHRATQRGDGWFCCPACADADDQDAGLGRQEAYRQATGGLTR